MGDSGVAGADDFDVSTVAQEVGGQFQLYGTGTAVLETLERLQQVVRNGLDLSNHGIPVGYGLEHPKLVLGFVGGVAALADEVAFYVGGHLQEGRAGEVGFAHRAHRVGGARASTGNQDAGFAGGAGISVGHEAAAKFETPADEAQIVLLVEQSVEQVKVMYADDAEYRVNALGLQGLGYGLAAGEIGHGCTP